MATVTTLKSGTDTTGAVWSGGSKPVDGDKVTISKLGTATSRTTSGAISAGATNVPVTAGTGTGLIGEVIEFDSRPGEYYELTTGFTASAGTAVVTPALAGAIASGATLRNRGHKVVLTGTTVWGDDTSTGVTVNGVLYWDRASSASLQVKGTYTVSATGTEDRGTAIDPITGVNATLLLNYSAALAQNKYQYTKTAGGRIKHYGVNRTRKTTLTGAASAGAVSLSVAAASNWANGDSLLILPTTATAASGSLAEFRTVNSVSGTTIGISSGLTLSRLSGAYVINLTSNIVTSPFDATKGFTATFSSSAASVARDVDLFHSLLDAGTLGFSVGWTLSGSSGASDATAVYADSCTFRAATTRACLEVNGTVKAPVMVRSTAVDTTSSAALYISGASYFDSGVAAGTSEAGGAIGVNGSTSNALGTITNNLLYASGRFITPIAAGLPAGTFTGNTLIVGSTQAATQFSIAFAGSTISGNSIDPFSANSVSSISATSYSGRTTLSSNRFVTDPSWTFGSVPNTRLTSIFATGRSNSRTHEIWDNEGYAYSDTSTRNRGDAALQVVNRTTSPFVYTFTAAVAAGATKRLVAYLRRNATYAAGSMPTITLSIPNVTSVVSSVTDTADTWFKTDLSIANSNATTQEVTVTLSANGAANASSSAWFDGIPIYPFVQAVRHFGFTFDETNPFRTVDTSITVSETTALAYPIVVSHNSANSGVIHVNGDATSRQIYEACIADLCQTANLSVAKHITTADDGVSFTTTYSVLAASGVTITGNYTDASGAFVTVSATLPVAGCRIQLYDLTSNVELLNQTVSGTTLTYRTLHTSDVSLRLRVAYQSGTTAKLPQTVFATLTAAGAVFTVPDEDDDVYIGNGIDGATTDVSGGGEFSADYPHLQIDVSDGDGTTSVQRVYAWSAWANTQASGIQLMFGAVTAQDALNYTIDPTIVDAQFDNTSASPCIITGGYIRRTDNTTVIASTSGSIQMDPGRAYLAGGGSVPTAAQNAAAVRTELTTELARIDVATSTRLAGASYTAPDNTSITAIKAKTDNLPAAPASTGDVTSARDSIKGSGLPTVADVLARTDVATSTRLAAASYTAPDNTSVAAIKAKTDNLPAAPAAVGDIPTAAQVSDKLLGRNLGGAADGGRTVQDALRASRNKTEIVGTTLTVYAEDDTTPAWTANVTTAERDALSGIDPA